MRDRLRPNDLNSNIQQLTKGIDILKKSISKAAQDQVSSVKSGIYEYSIQKTIVLYSLGKGKEEVKESLIETIDAFAEGFIFDDGYGDYDVMAWIISLCILCDVDDDEFKKITQILSRDRANDKLLSMLIRHIDSSWTSSGASVIQKHPYSKAAEAKDIYDLKSYLQKVWYQGHSDAWWYDIHKNKKVNRHFGYWAWEAAALVKINDWDDTILKGVNYYPYDATHW